MNVAKATIQLWHYCRSATAAKMTRLQAGAKVEATANDLFRPSLRPEILFDIAFTS
jgi:hypothetical protein